MQTLTEKTHRLAPPGGLFDDSVVRNLFPDASEGAKKLLVHRALKHGEVLRLKPGLYCLAPEYRKSDAHPFVVAAVLHSPSHVSLESALAYHGLIPEAVYTVSSVTSLRSRVFDTPLGRFSFQRVPAVNPRAGVEAIEVARDSWAFVATPPRAIADLIYLRKNVYWESDGLAFLTESMRIEEEDLAEITTEEFEEVLAGMRNKRVRTYLTELRNEARR
jgi:predicted transcriptional regulator of viral defense system